MKRPVSVALVRPPVDVLHKFSKPIESLALGYLAAAIRAAGHEAVLLDGMLHEWSEAETATRILAARPEVVGFTVVLNHFPDSVTRIGDLLRDAGFGGPILVGGHAVSFFPERILDAIPIVDGVICGEGEAAVRHVVEALHAGTDWRAAPGMCSRRGGDVRRVAPVRNQDLDALQDPARDITPALIELDGLVAISTSRGCYARCSFCSVPRFFGLHRSGAGAVGSWLARSVPRVVEEIVSLHRSFGVTELLIVDDEFFGGTGDGVARALELGRRLEAEDLPLRFALSCRAENADREALEQLQRGGLTHVFIGLEAGTEADLKLYGKGQEVQQNIRAVQTVKALGMSFQPGYMLFNHHSTIERVRDNLRFLQEVGECKPVTIHSSVEPHFGAPLTADMFRSRGARDEGLSMVAVYRDPLVAAAREAAARCAEAFVPYMNTIAGLQSAVTYEWRRRVPGRTPATRALIDSFEARVNRAFAALVVDTVDQLCESGARPEAVLGDLERGIASTARDLDLAAALTLGYVDRAEGGVRYYKQLDVAPGKNAGAATAEAR